MVAARHHLAIGLHESGKTTFLAALWHVLISNEIPTALRLHKLDGDRTHLNKLRDAWLRCEPVPRTSGKAEQHVRMLLSDAANHVDEVWFPDLSGEALRDQWEQRRWPLAYEKIVDDAESILLFVHPDRVVEPLPIVAVAAVAAGVPPPAGAPQPKSQPAKPTPWDAKQAPTQVQLVDLLQLLRWRTPQRNWGLSVVISAWDVARNLGQSPSEWCAKRLPLLNQYLRANTGRFRLRYYGVSALGGELPGDAERLRALPKASSRIEVVREGQPVTNDLTVILHDLAGGA